MSRGDTARVELLLRRGLSTAVRCDEGFSLLQIAAAHGHSAIVDLLLDHGAAPDALHAAVAGGDPAIVERLIQRGASVDVRDGAGFTPLHQAVAIGARRVVAALLKARADVSLEVGDTGPLQLARRVGDPVIAGMLHQRRARS